MPLEKPDNCKLGLVYFPDTLHYRESDLKKWLPEVKAMGGHWLTLTAPIERAIPYSFIQGLVSEGIQPVLVFSIPPDDSYKELSLGVLFESYAHWGVKYVVPFEKPNLRRSWSAKAWLHPELVERFLDYYTPVAQIAIQSGLTPCFPALEPGGDFWDTSFYTLALRGMSRRDCHQQIDHFHIAMDAWSNHLPLDWGSGGPEIWPNSQPYQPVEQQIQNQLGFRAFDWYNSITQAEFGSEKPIIILRAGITQVSPYSPEDNENHTPLFMEMIDLIDRHAPVQPESDLPTADILACNLWLLATSPTDRYQSHAFFNTDGTQLPIVQVLKEKQQRSTAQSLTKSIQIDEAVIFKEKMIPHYLLLPQYAWGAADWDIEAIRPLIRRYYPTIGFSVTEALNANRVTLVGKPVQNNREVIQRLTAAGCLVDALDENGNITPLGIPA
jgi:hypothetical protein